MKRLLGLLVVLVVSTASLGSSLAGPGFARFTDGSGSNASSFAAATLQPPASVSASSGTSIVVNWSTAPSLNGAGYHILRSATSGGPYTQVGQVTPATAASYTDTPATPGLYYYVVRSYFQSWESANSTQTSATASTPQPLRLATGSYTGNGADNRTISGIGFQPDVVIVKCSCSQATIVRTSTIAGDAAKILTNASALTANLIQSLTSTGFTIGSDNRVNRNGNTYYWTALKTGSALSIGTYVGNGADNRSIAGLGFRPVWVLTMGDGENSWFRPDGLAGDASYAITANNSAANRIQALETDGFQVGANNDVNRNGTTFHYIAFNTTAAVVRVGSYTGNAADNRNVTGLGLSPDFAWVKRGAGSPAVFRPASLAGDASMEFNAAAANNQIQSLIAGGFQVGTVDLVNANAETYYYLAIEDPGP
jgi:hypothetical protein